MIEAALLSGFYLIGYGLLAPLRPTIGGANTHALALPIGCAALVLVGWVQLVVPIVPYSVTATLLVVALGGAGGVVWTSRRRRLPLIDVVAVPAIGGATFLASLGVQSLNAEVLTSDSIRYIIAASSLADTGGMEMIRAHTVVRRALGLPLLHAPASLADQPYLSSLLPLLGIAAIAGLVTLAWTALGAIDPDPVWRSVLIAVAVAFLLSTNRFLFNLVYVHTHLIFSLYTFVLVATAWIGTVRRDWAWFVVALPSAAVVLTVRPDGFLVVLLALTPIVAAVEVPYRLRLIAASTYAGIVIVWFGTVVRPRASEQDGLVAAGAISAAVALLAVTAALRSPGLQRIARFVPHAFVAGIVAGLALLALGDPTILETSLAAFGENLVDGRGRWRWTWLALPVLLVLALAARRLPLASWWWTPTLGFLPLLVVLAYLRGTPFRIGWGDSANRMLFHILFVAVVFVVIAAASAVAEQHPTDRSTPREDEADEPPGAPEQDGQERTREPLRS